MTTLIERARKWGEELNQQWLEKGIEQGRREGVERGRLEGIELGIPTWRRTGSARRWSARWCTGWSREGSVPGAAVQLCPGAQQAFRPGTHCGHRRRSPRV